MTCLVPLVSLLLLAPLLLAAPVRAQAAPLPVVTSISPLADLIGNVGGDRVQVTALVPVGGDPHDFDPSPEDVITVANARVFFVNGLGQERFLEGLLESARPADLRVVTLSEAITPLRSGEGPEAPPNPHAWLSVANAMAYVERIRDTLKEVDPEGAATYEANAARYLAELTALDEEIKAMVGTIPPEQRYLVTFHDAWPYFCERYGLTCVALVGATEEAQPSALEFAAVVDLVRAHGIKAVFGEEGFSDRLVEPLARDTGARFVAGLLADTLGAGEDANSYAKMMRRNAERIVAALR